MLLSMPAFKLQFGGCAVGSGLNTMVCAPLSQCCGGQLPFFGLLAGPTRCLLACSLQQQEKGLWRHPHGRSSWRRLTTLCRSTALALPGHNFVAFEGLLAWDLPGMMHSHVLVFGEMGQVVAPLRGGTGRPLQGSGAQNAQLHREGRNEVWWQTLRQANL